MQHDATLKLACRNVLTTLQAAAVIDVDFGIVSFAGEGCNGATRENRITDAQMLGVAAEIKAILEGLSGGRLSLGSVTCRSVSMPCKFTVKPGPLPTTFTADSLNACTINEQIAWTTRVKEAIGPGAGGSRTTVVVLPPGCKCGMAGITQTSVSRNASIIVRGESALKASITAHEILHNVGLGHSFFRSDAYGDPLCIMGNTLTRDRAQRNIKTINAAQTYFAGWLARAQFFDCRISAGQTLEFDLNDAPDDAIVVHATATPASLRADNKLIYGDPGRLPILFVSLRDGAVRLHDLSISGEGSRWGASTVSRYLGAIEAAGGTAVADLSWSNKVQEFVGVDAATSDKLASSTRLDKAPRPRLGKATVRLLAFVGADDNKRAARVSVTVAVATP